jgi:hypothetical protein
VAVSVGLGVGPAFTVVAKKFDGTVPPAGKNNDGGAKEGVMFVVKPAESVPWLVTAAEKVMGPAKLFMLITVTVETTELPLGTETEPGTARTVNCGTLTVIATVVW